VNRPGKAPRGSDTLALFITGGSGFIGRNLAQRLKGDYEILAPSHEELELLDEEAVREFFRKRRVDAVIHCAIKPGHRNAPDPTHLVYPNTRSFFNLARNADRFGKMIWLSSGAVYDLRHYRPKMNEDYFDAHVPVDETGFYKYVCAKYAQRSSNIIELRPFGVFGPYEDWEIRFISNAICKSLFDLPSTIGQNRRFDYLYVDDLAQVIRYFIENDGRYGAYNVTPDQALELKTLAEKVRAQNGKDLEIKISRPGMGVEYSGSNRRLREEISGLQLTGIDEAIARLYEWYGERRHLIRREALLHDK